VAAQPPPAAPVRKTPDDWEHYALWQRVWDALRVVPDYFKTSTSIEGILGPDIFTLNTVLGATIEEQVVRTLNSLRSVWDPNKQYQNYAFERQAQVFPDVILRRKTDGEHHILMGIELKGWYLLAKEGAPSLRFQTTAAACNPWDLIAVVPWSLSNVLAGSPVTFTPWIELARYCAEQRNHFWQYERKAKGDATITVSTHATAYPKKSDLIADKAVVDNSNFGRLARYGLMGDYVTQMKAMPLSGIPVSAWLSFFTRFKRTDEDTPEE
jgi:hypothetical protein